jgi:hypothetical protein
MRTHASILPLLGAPLEGFFWNLSEFDHCIQVDALHGHEICPFKAHFLSRKSQNSLGERCGGYDDWEMTGMLFFNEELLHNK